jgi:signal transduction histidine kinase
MMIFMNSSIAFFVVRKSISKMMYNLIETEVNTLKCKYEKDRATPSPYSKSIHMYKGRDALPKGLKGRIKDLAPGVYALNTPESRLPINVGVIDLPDQDSPYFLILNGDDYFKENAPLRPRYLMLIALSLLLVLAATIGYVISRMLYAPVVKLMDQIRGLNPENIPVRLSEARNPNEIGMLTQTIETAMTRIKSFIQREKRFTRDASHELRTPLTIVGGAVEIMEQQPEVENNPLLFKPLKRISQSVKDMQATIETFLWLAREENLSNDTCKLAEAVQKAVDANRHLIADKNVALQVDILTDKSLQVKEEILYITIINLIRNACQHTDTGTIRIVVDQDHITITDTGVGIDSNQLSNITKPHIKGEKSDGFGLGLSIVERLCQRFGWELDIESRPGEGTRVSILFKDARYTITDDMK